ncbi:MAG TPA: hypothetical protein P5084_15825 [Paludibacter sp.]|nr:hypothetical protein [Paludibacter sp.]
MKHWSQAQIKYVFKHFESKPIPQIAKDVGRSERALRLFLHRHRNDPKLLPKKNLLIQLIQKKFRDVECFVPSRNFFKFVQIGQKRYWSLYKGTEQITDEELKKIAEYFSVTLEGIYEARQVELWNTNEK